MGRFLGPAARLSTPKGPLVSNPLLRGRLPPGQGAKALSIAALSEYRSRSFDSTPSSSIARSIAFPLVSGPSVIPTEFRPACLRLEMTRTCRPPLQEEGGTGV